MQIASKSVSPNLICISDIYELTRSIHQVLQMKHIPNQTHIYGIIKIYSYLCILHLI